MSCKTLTVSASSFCLHSIFPTAFDTIDFYLADRLKADFGISGVALDWLLSFLIGSSQYVGAGWSCSTPVACSSGVPHGPLLFALHISPIDNVVSAHRLHLHQYADDTQPYMAVRPADNLPLEAASQCVSDVSRWFLGKSMLLQRLA